MLVALLQFRSIGYRGWRYEVVHGYGARWIACYNAASSVGGQRGSTFHHLPTAGETGLGGVFRGDGGSHAQVFWLTPAGCACNSFLIR